MPPSCGFPQRAVVFSRHDSTPASQAEIAGGHPWDDLDSSAHRLHRTGEWNRDSGDAPFCACFRGNRVCHSFAG